LELGEQALAIATALNHRAEIGRCLNMLGAAHYVMGRYRQAEGYFDRALVIFQDLNNPRQVMDLLSNLGVLAEARGDHDLALQRYHKALEIARQIGHRDGEIVFLTNLGGEKVALEEHGAAESDLREAIRLAGAAGSYVLALTYGYLSQACLGLDKQDEALTAAQRALALGQETEAPEDIGVAWRALGMIAEKIGEPVSARDPETERIATCAAEACFEQSAKVLLEAGLDGQRARTLREWAKYELKRGNQETGLAMWQEARDLFTSLEATREVERMDETGKRIY
jgi:tetratricopeptide (TPR) repeat protein